MLFIIIKSNLLPLFSYLLFCFINIDLIDIIVKAAFFNFFYYFSFYHYVFLYLYSKLLKDFFSKLSYFKTEGSKILKSCYKKLLYISSPQSKCSSFIPKFDLLSSISNFSISNPFNLELNLTF